MNTISQKKKWIAILLCLFLFPVGAHAFYTGRFKRGIFFLASIGGIFSYFFYLISKISHSVMGHYLHFKAYTWFTLYLIAATLLGHVPFVSFIGSFATYPVYLFALGILFWIYDFIMILFGRFKDSEGNRIQMKKS